MEEATFFPLLFLGFPFFPRVLGAEHLLNGGGFAEFLFLSLPWLALILPTTLATLPTLHLMLRRRGTSRDSGKVPATRPKMET